MIEIILILIGFSISFLSKKYYKLSNKIFNWEINLSKFLSIYNNSLNNEIWFHYHIMDLPSFLLLIFIQKIIKNFFIIRFHHLIYISLYISLNHFSKDYHLFLNLLFSINHLNQILYHYYFSYYYFLPYYFQSIKFIL